MTGAYSKGKINFRSSGHPQGRRFPAFKASAIVYHKNGDLVNPYSFAKIKTIFAWISLLKSMAEPPIC
jgi:hypothetical protein